MAKANYIALLKAAQKVYSKAPTAGDMNTGNPDVPDGRYLAKLTAIKLDTEGGKVVSIWDYTIEDGDCEGQVISNRYRFASPDNVSYFKRDLLKFGMEPEQIEGLDLAEDLPALQENLVAAEPSCRITVRTKDDFQNIFLNKVESMEEVQATDEPDEAMEEETVEEEKPAPKKAAAKAVPAKKAAVKKEEPAEEPMEEEIVEEDEAVELTIGMKVVVAYKGEEHAGVVKELLEDTGMVKVTVPKIKKIITVKPEDIEIAE